MNSRNIRSHALLCLGLATLATGLRAQNITLNNPTRSSTSPYAYDTWKPVLTIGDGYLYESATADASASGADIVSTGSTASGFFIQYGKVNNLDSFAFRILLDSALGGSKTVRLGLDGNLDGSIDLFVAASTSTVTFQDASTAAQTTPGTTGWANTNVGNSIALNANNLDTTTLAAANVATAYPGWTLQGGNDDVMMSFGVPIAELNTALAAANAGYQLTSTSMMRWVAFTTNNSNVHDVYGLGSVGTNGNVTYASFVQVMNAAGQPIPEPAAYGLTMVPCLAAFICLRRPRRSIAR